MSNQAGQKASNQQKVHHLQEEIIDLNYEDLEGITGGGTAYPDLPPNERWRADLINNVGTSAVNTSVKIFGEERTRQAVSKVIDAGVAIKKWRSS
jgi:hypothetical protein